ncbi:heavy metal sensor histidine kinase [Escherichia albertii NBRC 107761 = DSM 17582]|uniref:heavy metal sensor histidine kinase n=1 Tax=Escherichia albertii TaxID=208962 RepID=UPI000507CA65|nr:heavy metal sensor histidine kinase [Escherichia albertii]EKG0290634.1 heavy metal sensor histidine kinase [Escherichia albertii]MCJ2196559.1 heavy metal sensor histidine kinase [Escherichia albertii NBRC 107761 = DSM 17582]MCZ8798328.1 heavy metal sensor histidine kinase [Escherichia albertii]GAL55298.1 putative two-component histidine kinase YedV [Escherichia albertii NBRC 107761 = DSM 17582]HAH3029627.1 two-component sensor histidine kinase [Escherichia albertii]
MKRLSITVRLTLLFILLLSVAGSGIVWTLYSGLASELKWRDDTTLINRTAQIKQLLIDGVNPDTLPVYFNRMMDVSQDILIIHGTGINKIVNRTNVNNDMLNNIPASETISIAGIYRSIINDTEIDALRINIDEVTPSLTVTVAKLASARHNMLEQYKINSIIICVVTIILCSVLSPILIKTGLRDIKKLCGVTENMNYNDISEPVETSSLPGELKPLGQALNKMHQALVKDFERLSQFADDLAHELRTPINALLGQNQVTLSQTRSLSEYQKTIAGNIEELENISRLTENILFLARAQKSNVLINFELLSLKREVENLIDYLEYLSDEKDIHFKIDCDRQIYADKILLQRMLSNLIVNAIRYSPEKSLIYIASFLDENSYLNIDIASHGARINEPEKLFRRFWRGDNSRHSVGHGLGLSLVKAIAELHGGSATYHYINNNNVFRIILPQRK